MSDEHDDWPGGRIFHLAGGIRAMNLEGPEVALMPTTIKGTSAGFRANTFRSVYSDLAKRGLEIIGVDFFANPLEIERTAPPEWRVFHQGWPSRDLTQKWSEIANAAFKKNDGHAWDLAARVSYQMDVCNLRVRQASEAYAEQLNAKSKQGSLAPGLGFEDGFTRLGYIAIQSYLIDVCTLRDYLAEFVANFIWSPIFGIDGSQISSMSGLIKKALKEIPSTDPLSSSLKEATGNGGWLQELGAYRDLVVHTAPLSTAGARLFGIIEYQELDPTRTLPILRLPLPINPQELMSQRATRQHFSDFSAQMNIFTQMAREKFSSVDALGYIWKAHRKIAELAGLIGAASPLKGEILVITDSDIIGDIRVL